MSLQSRAAAITTTNTNINTTTEAGTATTLVAGTAPPAAAHAHASGVAEFSSLHTIEQEGGGACPETGAPAPATSPTGDGGSQRPPVLRVPSFGSAFLSDLLSAVSHGGGGEGGGTRSRRAGDGGGGGEQPPRKKARGCAASVSFGRPPPTAGGGSVAAGAGAGAGGGADDPASPVVAAPTTAASASSHLAKVQEFNDQVRELQDMMAFPTLPRIPIAVSSTSCSCATPSSSQGLASNPSFLEGGGDAPEEEEPDASSYGWFVSTDAYEADAASAAAAPTFLPQPDLAFKALAAPEQAGNQDLVVQQALAADTIDEVLGDLF